MHRDAIPIEKIALRSGGESCSRRFVDDAYNLAVAGRRLQLLEGEDVACDIIGIRVAPLACLLAVIDQPKHAMLDEPACFRRDRCAIDTSLSTPRADGLVVQNNIANDFVVPLDGVREAESKLSKVIRECHEGREPFRR